MTCLRRPVAPHVSGSTGPSSAARQLLARPWPSSQGPPRQGEGGRGSRPAAAPVLARQPHAERRPHVRPVPERALGAFQPVGQEGRTPAGTELENTLAEPHFPGARDSATLNRLLWQQAVLARAPVSLGGAICFPTATRKAAAVLQQESLALPEPLARGHTGLPAPTRGAKAPWLLGEQSGYPCPREVAGGLGVSHSDTGVRSCCRGKAERQSTWLWIGVARKQDGPSGSPNDSAIPAQCRPSPSVPTTALMRDHVANGSQTEEDFTAFLNPTTQ